MAQESTTVQVWRFVYDYVQRYGVAPSRQEIATGCFISKSAVQRQLWKLEGMGALELLDEQVRGIRAVQEPPPHSEHSF